MAKHTQRTVEPRAERISAEREQAIRQRAEKATDGPWQIIEDRYDDDGSGKGICGKVAQRRIATTWHHPQLNGPTPVVNGFTTIWPVNGKKPYHGVSISAEDAEFMAHARQDIPDLLAEIDQLRADLEARAQEIADARADAEDLEAQLSAAQQELKLVQGAFTATQRKWDDAEAQLSALRGELAQVKREREAALDIVKVKNGENDVLRGANAAFIERVDALTLELRQAGADWRAENNQHTESIKELAELSAAHLRLREALMKLPRYNCDCLPDGEGDNAVYCERDVVRADELEAALASVESKETTEP